MNPTLKELTIKELVNQAHSTAVEKGWWVTDRNFLEQLMLMVTELSEVAESYRDGKSLLCIHYPHGTKKPGGVASEFADVLIRIADTCGKYGIPLEEALLAKLEYNATRSYRHGGKFA